VNQLPRISARSLKDYQNCHRLFGLRHIQHAFWPGTPKQPEEPPAALALGEAFHLLVQVHELGVDVSPMLGALPNPEGRLTQLWHAFLGTAHARPDPQERRWTEQTLSYFVAGLPAVVRFDRLVERDGSWTIYDWKTGRVNRKGVQADWQTRLYLHALVAAGECLGLGPIAPERARIVYWEVATGEAVPVAYSQELFEADGRELELLAGFLKQPFDPKDPHSHFPPMDTHCDRCSYHSLCNRTEADLAAPGAIRAPSFT
jgi:hypothetical protein